MMTTVNPKYILALIAVIVLAIYLKVSNPYRKYGTSVYWKDATIESIQEIPDEAFKPGNSNGSLLLWAAGDVSDPAIIAALVQRGGDINEVDGIFMGTPLTSSASRNSNSAVIREIVKQGGDINVRVMHSNTALMTAALYNKNPNIIETLVELGSKIDDTNNLGMTALDLAIKEENTVAIEALVALGAHSGQN